MNYIKLINSFWEIKRENESIDVYATTLYFTLLYLANRSNWQAVSVYRDDILELAGIRKAVYYDARKILQDAGLISFTEGNKKASKCIFYVRHTDIKADIKQVDMSATRTKSETLSETLSGTIHNKQVNIETYKHKGDEILKNENDFSEIETGKIISLPTESKNEKEETQKEKKQAVKKEKDFADVIFPFDSPAFKEIWNIWMEYRKQQKLKPYMPIGLQAALTKLANDANGEESEAIEIIKFSMSKQWQGLYPEKNKQHSKQPKKDWRNDLETISNFKFK